MNAFPFVTEIQRTESGSGERHLGDSGMSLRQWYAGQALAGLSAIENFVERHSGKIPGWAYEFADAMIEEGNK